MAFVSWATEYARAKDALANKTWDDYFVSSVESRVQMKTMYTKLNNITAFIDWLRMKAEEESFESETGLSAGSIPYCIGGG